MTTPNVHSLARRVMFWPRDEEDTAQVTQEAFYGEEAWQLRTLLAYMRLVRAGRTRRCRASAEPNVAACATDEHRGLPNR